MPSCALGDPLAGHSLPFQKYGALMAALDDGYLRALRFLTLGEALA
jgi:hypothetical protein